VRISLTNENEGRSKPMTRVGQIAWVLLAAAGLIAMTGFATFAVGLDRLALWQVVQGCVADFKLTGAPFPCLEVNLAGGEARGDVVLRPPLTHDMILAPTLEIVGLEDPFLQSPYAPNYFDAAWRARSLLKGAGGRRPDRDEVALVVNSAFVRTQDQLHIHVGCLRASLQRAIAAAAPHVPIGEWEQLRAIVPHRTFWGTRVDGTDLADVDPFRLAVRALADKVTDLRKAMIMVAGVRVAGEDGFLILATYAGAPLSWPVGADDVFEPRCSAQTRLGE
jgi:CDP-diacylglycerol pyrophosphatase